MLCKRVIVCLDVDGGRVVKGVRFRGLRDVGDPVELAERYEREGADEIVFLDISASTEERRTLLDVVQRTAERLFIPLTVGGGIRDLDDIHRVLRAGADKVSINTAAVQRPELLREGALRYGRQCMVISIDAKRVDGERCRVHTHGGRIPAQLEATDWAARCTELGAGEVLITSIDEDGGRRGYDLALTRSVSAAVSVPVIASGGAGSADHMRDALLAGAAGALAAGMFHDGAETIAGVKARLTASGIPIRQTGPTTDAS
jgi:cyclase